MVGEEEPALMLEVVMVVVAVDLLMVLEQLLEQEVRVEMGEPVLVLED